VRQAATEAARTKVKRAAGLLRDASRDLAQAAEPPLGTIHVADLDTVRQVRDLISVGVARYGAVDVIVLPRPRGRAHQTTAPEGAKEHHADQDQAAR
jgi:hypothetical protein